MNEKGFTGIFLSALIIGAAATFSVYKLVVEQRIIPLTPAANTLPVVVAVQDLPEGTLIDATQLRVKQYNEESVPKGAYAEVDSLVGRVTKIPVFADEPILEAKLAPLGTAAGLEVKIQPGFRAMSIPVNDHVGISGLIQPNSHVDVLVTLKDKGGREKRAKVFLQNLRVLSVGQQLSRDEEGQPVVAKTVTLEVTPDEAELLAVAMNEGVLSLALRGYSDADSIKTAGATQRNVMASHAKYRPAPRARAARPTPTRQAAPAVVEDAAVRIQIFRGSEMSERTIQVDDSTEKQGAGGGTESEDGS